MALKVTRIETGEDGFKSFETWVNKGLEPGYSPASLRKWKVGQSNEGGRSGSRRTGKMVETVG